MDKMTRMLGVAAVGAVMALGTNSAEAATIDLADTLKPGCEVQQLSFWTKLRDRLLDREDDNQAPPPPPPRRDPPPPPSRPAPPPPPRHQAPPPPPRHQAPPPPRPRAAQTGVEMQQLTLTSGMVVAISEAN